MAPGFVLRRLEVSGPGKPPAVVTFGDGLNVIYGPSDTGKSYILQCIDFCLGAGSPPESIDAAAGYTDVALTIEGRADHVRRRLQRPLKGGAATLTVDGETSRSLAAKHKDGSTKTISGYLLDLCGLLGHRVRRTAHGVTRGISFRDIAQLSIVDEQAIIDKRPPSRSRYVQEATANDRVFRFLLTGTDDSSIVADDDPKLKERRGGRAEILEKLLEDLAHERSQAAVQVKDIPTAERTLEAVTQDLELKTSELEREQQTSQSIEERRRPVWSQVREAESRLDLLRQLQIRFELLRTQYRVDLERLTAIAEVGGRLHELSEERCAICGALATHHDHDHTHGLPRPSEIAAASEAESAKIRKLARDLDKTVGANATEIDALVEQHKVTSEELARIEAEVNAELRPRLMNLTASIRAAERERQRLSAGLALRRREVEMQMLLAEAQHKPSKGSFHGVLAGATTGEAEVFAESVEAQLRAWRFPDLQRVTFSDEAQDIVVSGQARRSRGQGVRALTHAAFTLGLLRFALDNDRLLPGFAILDSPLVVYEEPDPGEDGFSPAVKDHFYRHLAMSFSDGQVVILENGAPPEDIANLAALTHFTKSDLGRYGFIPR